MLLCCWYHVLYDIISTVTGLSVSGKGLYGYHHHGVVGEGNLAEVHTEKESSAGDGYLPCILH